MTKYNHYVVEACATFTLDTFGTERQCEKEFNKKLKLLKIIAKQLEIDLWVDEVNVNE